ncbi:MAG: Na/Pi symporter [Rhodospirillales bacterium]|nr:Na/Pi symporter [Rhodospirillales bacterium]
MYGDVPIALGGIGLFLLGMIILTQGLRDLAGSSLRRVLARFTSSPLKGAAAGAVVTAIVQSSSVTTVTAVGFVGAGLLTFPQGLGIVLGANIGTTITGWLVALLGFKLSLGSAVLPLVLIGALLRLFGGSRLAAAGWALAGFGVLFIGIETMQEGMSRLEGIVTPADFPDDSLGGRLLLVLIGVGITLVTQSSSVGVATALAALGSGAISFPQAAAMTIGMDVGTTFKAALATLGGSTATRRTGFAHVIYNLMTGVLALCILDLYALLTERWLAGGGAEAAQFALVGFHTTFNVLGVVLVLPFAEPFARFLTFLFQERGPALTRRLDDRLLDHPPLAVYAATSTAGDIIRHVASAFGELLDPRYEAPAGLSESAAFDDALVRTRSFVDRIRSESLEPELQSRHAATIHILDHSLRLIHRGQQEDRVRTLHTEHRLRRLSLVLSDALNRSAEATIASEVERFHRITQLLGQQRRRYRELMVMSAISAEVDTETALMRLDAMRWLYRVSYHLSRIAHHMSCMERGVRPAGARDEIAGEVALD